MAKTVVEKVNSPDTDVTIFKISGTLGFHENQVLTKFFDECSNRGIHKLVMDFSDLGSLGGGCAKIIRDAAAAGQVRLCVAGASKTVQNFLEKKGPTSILFASNTASAVAEINSFPGTTSSPQDQSTNDDASLGDGVSDESVSAAPQTDSADEEPGIELDDVISDVDDILQRGTQTSAVPPDPGLRQLADDQVTDAAPAQQTVPAAAQKAAPAQQTVPAAAQKPAPVQQTAPATAQKPVPAQQTAPATSQNPVPVQQPAPTGAQKAAPAQQSTLATAQKPASAQNAVATQERPANDVPAAMKDPAHEREPAPTATAGKPSAQQETAGKTGADDAAKVKELKRLLVQYKWLFSLNADFSAIEDKGQLLDAFLLTTIAQVGVEAAAFLELSADEFVARCWKGFETADPAALNIDRAEVDIDGWIQSPRIFPLEDAPLSDAARQRMDSWDLVHAAPFVVRDGFRGLVMLGRPIRGKLDGHAWEFLNMMISQVAIAYENSCRLEKETERTLGLVQSLISMVESNTLSDGTTELVMDLTYAMAVKMHYPEEHIRDLMYGTVLRDIGMIKTSDLILRSPRELMKEEWEVIKQHPIEGAEMLGKMNFSEHTQDIVKYHHERYNGEGYPSALADSQIPLGARILSVVESYAAMLQDRPTRPALSREEAIATLEENWGLRYDPEIVKEFVEVIDEEIRTGKRPRYKGIDLVRK